LSDLLAAESEVRARVGLAELPAIETDSRALPILQP
jgi:hypothetical protein